MTSCPLTGDRFDALTSAGEVASRLPRHPLLRRRDPAFITRALPWLRAANAYFRSEVEGAENLLEGRSLLASVHNGGAAMPDMYALMGAFWDRFGTEAPGYGVMHAVAFRVPVLGRMLVRFGAVPASYENAETVVRSGYPLLICPGGDEDALKPFRARHTITFGKRRGFIRLALRNDVPIVPIVSVGAHEAMIVLNDGRRTAELSGLARFLRIKSVPLALSFPFGLTIAGVPSLPLPSKVRVRVLPAIELHERRGAADDPPTVERCFEHVRATMQAALTELAGQRKHFLIG